MLLHAGDTLPALVDVLTVDGEPLSLDGATVDVTLVGPATIEGEAEPGENTGEVGYAWADGDTAVGGVYQARWKVTTGAGVRTITGTDVVIYDPAAIWITPAEVDSDADTPTVIRQLVAAQQAILDAVTRPIPTTPVPAKVKRALSILTARALLEPAGAGSVAVSYESIADYAVRYVSPFAKGTVLDIDAHPDIAKMLRPWRPANYSSDLSGDATAVARASTSESTGLPTGGADGQVLAKRTGANYDTEWIDPPTGGGAGVPDGGTTGQVLAKSSDTDGDVDWVDPTTASDPTRISAALGIMDGEVFGPNPVSPYPFAGLGGAGKKVLISVSNPTIDGVYTVAPNDIDLIDFRPLSELIGYVIEVEFAARVGDGGPSFTTGEWWKIIDLVGAGVLVIDGNIARTVEPAVAAAVESITPESLGIDDELLRFNRWHPADVTPYGGAIAVNIHVIKFVTPDPAFPVDGSATHIGGQEIPDGQKVYITDNLLGNGGAWIAHLGAPWERATTLGPTPAAEIGLYDFVRPTGTIHLAESLWRMSGVGAGFTGLDDLDSAFFVSSMVRPTLIAETRTGDVFTLALPDGTTTALDVSATATDQTYCIFVVDTMELATIAGGAVAGTEDHSRFEVSTWVARGLPGVAAGGTEATVADGTAFLRTSGGGGAVEAVNGQTGVVELDASDVGADPAGSAAAVASATATALAGKQDADADLTAIAALTTTSWGRALLELANAGALRSLIDVEAGGARVVWTHGTGNPVSEPASATTLLTSGTATLPAIEAGDRWVLEGTISMVQNSAGSRTVTLTFGFGADSLVISSSQVVTASGIDRTVRFKVVGVALSPASHVVSGEWYYPTVISTGRITSTVNTASAGTAIDVKVTGTGNATQTYRLIEASLRVERAAA